MFIFFLAVHFDSDRPGAHQMNSQDKAGRGGGGIKIKFANSQTWKLKDML